MSDDALRRMLERASIEPPADLEARVFAARPRQLGWTAAAVVVMLIASLAGWAIAGRTTSDVDLTTDRHDPVLTTYPIGDGSLVATWLPPGFRQTHREERATTWSGPRGATITWQSAPVFDGRCACPLEALGPGHHAVRVDLADGFRLVWCQSQACGLEVHGVSTLDALRVAIGIMSNPQVTTAVGETIVPDLIGQWSKFVGAPGVRLRLTFRPDRSGREEYVVAQRPVAGVTVPAGSILTLSVGSAQRYDGFEEVRSGGDLVGWVDTRLADLERPIPVVSMLRDSRLQGYVMPGRGFVWLDELFAGETIDSTRSAVSGEWSGGTWSVVRDRSGCLKLLLSGRTGTDSVCPSAHVVEFFGPVAAAHETGAVQGSGPWLYFGVFDTDVERVVLRRSGATRGDARVIPTMALANPPNGSRFSVFEVGSAELAPTPLGTAEFVFQSASESEVHRLPAGPQQRPPQSE